MAKIEGKKKKKGWFVCQGLLHFTSDRRIFCLERQWGFYLQVGARRQEGRSRCLSHWQALWKLHPPLSRELSRRSCAPQIAASCQSGMAQQWVSRAAFWPKFNWITSQLLQPVPEAGNHHQLVGGICSQGQTVLLLICCNVFAGAQWEQWLSLLVLWMQHSLLPQPGGMMASWKKNR